MKKAVTLISILLFLVAVNGAFGQSINKRSLKIKPDLIVEKILVSPRIGKTLAPGKAVNIDCFIKNIGGAFSGTFKAELYIDSESIGSPIKVVYTGGVKKLSVARKKPTAGWHTATCVIDTDNDIDEANEKNNSFKYRFEIKKRTIPVLARRPVPAIDLRISRVQIADEDPSVPVAVRDGEHTFIYCHWVRTGPQPPREFWVRAFVDGNPVRTSVSDEGTIVDHTQARSWARFPWTATNGRHNIRCVVDSKGHIAEQNEANNDKSISIVIPFLPLI